MYNDDWPLEFSIRRGGQLKTKTNSYSTSMQCTKMLILELMSKSSLENTFMSENRICTKPEHVQRLHEDRSLHAF